MGSEEFLNFVVNRSEEIIERTSFRHKLAQRKNLRVKLGIDPTSPDLHLGHLVPIKMLRAFQEAGHKAVLIIGDFTGEIGDPSGKSRTRRQLTPAEVKVNQQTYRRQLGRVLDFRSAEVHYNSEWHSRMSSREFLRLLAHFPLKAAWEREDFQRRLKSGKAVWLHEAMYSVLQAYDSVAVRADIELGSLDQKLNLLAGRELQRSLGQPPQDVVLLPYLIGLDGREKMSKTFGNTINLRDSSGEMFGKAMSIPDRLIINYAKFAAWMSLPEVRAIQRRLENGENPRDAKLDVAQALVRLHYGPVQAGRAHQAFLQIYSRRELPRRAARANPKPGNHRPIELMRALGAVPSLSQARRLLRGRALEIDGRVINPGDKYVSIHRGSIIRLGKNRFFKVR